MLITQLKDKEALRPLIKGRVFLLICHGCREVFFPTEEAEALKEELAGAGRLAGALTTEYICRPENLRPRLQSRLSEIGGAETVLTLSCGVGVQTAARELEDRRVCAGCDTLSLPGTQGVTPLKVDCARCGECRLNLTGGICPVTACTKGLLNGPCGGARDGLCEAGGGMECGWERIFRRLKELGELDRLKSPVQIRNYAENRREDILP